MESSSPLPRRKSEQVNAAAPATAHAETTPVSSGKETNGLAVASLVCGGLSLFFGFFTALPAVICGHMALADLRRNPDKFESSTRGMAVAGLVLGYVFLVLTVLVILLFVFAIAASTV